MFSSEEFSYLVIGDEPAGIWCLPFLAEYAHPPSRVGWITFSRHSRYAVPVLWAEILGVNPLSLWSCQMVTPSVTFTWNPQTVSECYPELVGSGNAFMPRPERTSVEKILRKYPELFFYSQALWKFLGRTDRISPQNALGASLLAQELFWWNPKDALPSFLPTLCVDNVRGLELSFTRRNQILVTIAGQTYLTKALILNLSLSQLVELNRKSRDIFKKLGLSGTQLAGCALYPLRLVVEPSAIPGLIKPVMLAFDTSEIPDIPNEVWPVEVEKHEDFKELTLWATCGNELNLDAVLDRFRLGLQSLYHLFPHLSTRILGLSSALEMGSCFSHASRCEQLGQLEQARSERYCVSQMHWRTRHPYVFLLSPSLHSYFLYPLGPLYGAANLLRELLRKEKAISDRFRALL